jgi:hypothetical protein
MMSTTLLSRSCLSNPDTPANGASPLLIDATPRRCLNLLLTTSGDIDAPSTPFVNGALDNETALEMTRGCTWFLLHPP